MIYNIKKHTYEEVKMCVENLGYMLISQKYIKNNQKLILRDKFGYHYVITLVKLQQGCKPRIAYKSNPYSIQNIKLWCKFNNKKFKLLNSTYENTNKKLKWQCLEKDCGETFEMDWCHIYNLNQRCPYCTGVKVGLSNCLATKNPELAKQWHPTRNGDLTSYNVTANSNKKVWWLCEKGHEWKVNVASRNRSSSGCPYCSGFYPTKENNLLVNNPELCKEWDYTKNKRKPEEYTPYSGKKVWWICKECNYNWKAEIRSRNNGRSCPECNESKGEKRIKEYLKYFNIKYIPQYIFNNLLSNLGNLLRFDFGIINKNKIYLIEYDGIQHFEWISDWMTKEKFELIKYHDKLKNQYCQQNNISLLRIPYWDFDNIEIILKDYLITMQI